MKSSFIIIVLAGSVLLAACKSAPLREEAIQQARDEVQTLSQNPLASEVANRDLANSRTSLAAAESALKEKNQETLDHYSYLATRQAQTGQARIEDRQARTQLAQGEAERNRVLLEARERELTAAQQKNQSLQDAQQTERGIVLTLSDVLFDTSQATLKPGAGPMLDRVAMFMSQNPKTRVIIEGHTDSRGSAEYNEALSQRRADAVASALAVRGIERGRVEPVGRGEALPIASNSSAEGQQRNRRVELVFSDNAGKFAQGATEALR